MSLERRIREAQETCAKLEQQRRVALRKEQEAKRKTGQRRNFIIGDLVTIYFPVVQKYMPGTKAENRIRFEPLEAFLYVLSHDDQLVELLCNQSARLMEEDPDGEWRLSQ